MNIRVKAKMSFGKFDKKLPEIDKEVVITEEELIKKAKAKMQDDVHCGYWWALKFSNFEFKTEKEICLQCKNAQQQIKNAILLLEEAYQNSSDCKNPPVDKECSCLRCRICKFIEQNRKRLYHEKKAF